MASRRIAEGWKFVAVASDLGFLQSAARSTLRDLNLGADRTTARY